MKLKTCSKAPNLGKAREVHLSLPPHHCPGLYAISNFTIFRRFATKKSRRNDFSLLLCISHFTEGFRIQGILRKLRNVEITTIFDTLLFFVTFWFASLTRRGLRIQLTNSAKMARNRGCNDFSHFTISQYFFHFLTHQTGLPNSTNSLKSSKKSSFCPPYYFSLRLHHLAERPM